MFSQFGANFVAVRSAARKFYFHRKRLNFAGAVVLLAVSSSVSGCAVPVAVDGQDPANPQAKVAAVGYRSTVAPYTSLRPAMPLPWRQQNDSVAPSSKSGH
ncbi:MAG: hypothetical protein J0G33_12680 [Afipia felis]|nr:hypothetical protein [Afipia felis]